MPTAIVLPSKLDIRNLLHPAARINLNFLRESAEAVRDLGVLLHIAPLDKGGQRILLAVHHEPRRRPWKVVQQRPGDELGGRPGVLVGPEEELVAHPRQHRDRRVVHADAQGHGPLTLYRGVAAVVVHAVQCSVETMPFERCVFGLSVREVWLCHCYLWNLAPTSRQGWCDLAMF
jgi:hypothetical protein